MLLRKSILSSSQFADGRDHFPSITPGRVTPVTGTVRVMPVMMQILSGHHLFKFKFQVWTQLEPGNLNFGVSEFQAVRVFRVNRDRDLKFQVPGRVSQALSHWQALSESLSLSQAAQALSLQALFSLA